MRAEHRKDPHDAENARPVTAAAAGYSACPPPRSTPAGISYKLHSGSNSRMPRMRTHAAQTTAGSLVNRPDSGTRSSTTAKIGTLLHTVDSSRLCRRICRSARPDSGVRQPEERKQRIFAHAPQDEQRRQRRRQPGGDGDARHAKVQARDEKQIEHHVDGPGGRQRQKRIAAVAARPQHGRAQIVKQQSRMTQQIDPQVPRRGRKNAGRRADQPQQRPDEPLPRRRTEQPDLQKQQPCRAHRGRQGIFCPRGRSARRSARSPQRPDRRTA